MHIYNVWHEQNPEGKHILKFKEEQTPMRVKDAACTQRLFPWSEYTRLQVQKTKVNTSLDPFSGGADG